MSWPEEITWPMPSQFTDNSWVKDKHGDEYVLLPGNYYELGELTPADLEKYSCGSKFCLVGWVRHEFGRPANPECGRPLPREGMTMLRKIVAELTGKTAHEVLGPLSKHESDVAQFIATVMDGADEYDNHGVYNPNGKPMSPRQASNLMRRVLLGLGYKPNA